MRRTISEAKAVLMEVLRRPIAYHVVFARISGGVTSGVFLSQLFYWADRGKDPNGWIYKTQDEWEEETGLTRWEQETARKRLKKRGILEEKRAGMPARLHYRLNLDRVIELVAAQSSLWESHNQECGNPTNKNVETPQSSSRKSHNQDCGEASDKSVEKPQTSSRENHTHAETTREQQQTDDTENTAAAMAPSVMCSLHNVEMKLRKKNGDTWYSHRLSDGSWCKGAAGDQPGYDIERYSAQCTQCSRVVPTPRFCLDCERCWECCDCEKPNWGEDPESEQRKKYRGWLSPTR